MVEQSGIQIENLSVRSRFLGRMVTVDLYLPPVLPGQSLAPAEKWQALLINDGQDMEKMNFRSILAKFYASQPVIQPLICIAIHCGSERKREYGIAGEPDYRGRGDKADLHTSFVLRELLPLVHEMYKVNQFSTYAYAGFSLGALSAMDIAWNHPELFSRVGLFSASLWWRSVDQEDPQYDDDKHRIMHQQVRNSPTTPSLKFFFQCGNLDETKDRNQNGIIDSIDDTLDLIKELGQKGYDTSSDIYYLEMPDGRHDVPTWGRAMPFFLHWAWGHANKNQ